MDIKKHLQDKGISPDAGISVKKAGEIVPKLCKLSDLIQECVDIREQEVRQEYETKEQ